MMTSRRRDAIETPIPRRGAISGLGLSLSTFSWQGYWAPRAYYCTSAPRRSFFSSVILAGVGFQILQRISDRRKVEGSAEDFHRCPLLKMSVRSPSTNTLLCIYVQVAYLCCCKSLVGFLTKLRSVISNFSMVVWMLYSCNPRCAIIAAHSPPKSVRRNTPALTYNEVAWIPLRAHVSVSGGLNSI